MSKLKFSDGVEIETSGELRIHKEHDGLYVVGKGMLIPIKDREEGNTIIDKLKGKSKKANESMSMKESSIFEMQNKRAHEVARVAAKDLKFPNNSQKKKFIDNLRHALDKKWEHFKSQPNNDEIVEFIDNFIEKHKPVSESRRAYPTFESFDHSISRTPVKVVTEENSLKDLVGKADDEELDIDDARTIGKKISKMHGDDRKKYIGIVNFMGASCRIYNEIWANYKPVDPKRKKANKGKEYRGDKGIG